MNKNLKSIIVLVSICLISSALLATVNSFTAPLVEEYNAKKAKQACFDVMPNGTDFIELSLDKYNLSKEITKVYQETTKKGYVFEVTTTGYSTGLVIIIGIDSNNKVTNVKTLKSNETPSIGGKVDDESYKNQYIGKDQNLEDIIPISGATISSAAFKNAVATAFKGLETILEVSEHEK